MLSDRARVGSYGCTGTGRGGSRLVRVALADGVAKAPKTTVVDCPACGARHLVRPTWRKPEQRDLGVEPEVVIGVPEGVVAPATPKQ
jgi:hypothetical protein